MTQGMNASSEGGLKALRGEGNRRYNTEGGETNGPTRAK